MAPSIKRSMMISFNMPRIKVINHLKSQTLHNRRGRCRNKYMIWISSIIYINWRTTGSIVISDSKKALCFYMNINTKCKGNFMAYECSKTSVSAIGNNFVEVSQTEGKVTLAEFDDDISKKSILVGYVATAVNLQNVNLLSYLKNTPLLDWGTNPLLVTSHTSDFCVDIHYVVNCNGG